MWNDIRVGLSIASNTLRRGNRKTSVLTVLVLTLIFVNLIFLPSTINGMTDIFVDQVIDYAYGNIIIEPSQNKAYINKADSLLKKVNSINGVSMAAKRLQASATLSHKQNFVGASVYGIVPDKEVLVSKWHEALIDGEFLSKMSRDEIVVGRLLVGETDSPFGDVYDNLGGIPVGTLINVTYSNGATRQYKLIGIQAGGSELSEFVALVNYKELESVLGIEGEDRASNVVIRVENQGDEPVIKEKILDLGVKEDVSSWQDKIQDLVKDILESFNTLTIISVIVSVIIAVFVLFIIIYINTINKKRQIGILKAIGISSRSIIISYIFLSIFYTVAGIIIGGIAIWLLVMYFTANPLQFYETYFIVPKVDPNVVMQGVISLLFTGFLAGIVPSWLVTRQPILKAIWGR